MLASCQNYLKPMWTIDEPFSCWVEQKERKIFQWILKMPARFEFTNCAHLLLYVPICHHGLLSSYNIPDTTKIRWNRPMSLCSFVSVRILKLFNRTTAGSCQWLGEKMGISMFGGSSLDSLNHFPNCSLFYLQCELTTK